MKRRDFIQNATLITGSMMLANNAFALDSSPQPTEAQSNWMKLKYGMFIHFGPNTVDGVGWGDGKFEVHEFNPEVDPEQWADVAYRAGMNYAVLTARHLDGFCLWHTKYTDYSVKNAPQNKDIVRLFVNEFRKKGLKVGLYYSLWDRYQPFYNDDKVYALYMRNQITELLTQYGDIVELWFDGAWDKDHPTKDWWYDSSWETNPNSGLGYGERYEWKMLYDTIKSIQPNCLVINNTSSDRPGGVKYMPVDVRTSEHFDFVFKGKSCKAIADPIYIDRLGVKHYLPLEYCTSLNPDWFQTKAEFFNHPSVEQMVGWYKRARKDNANFLLNVGPNIQGVLPDVHIDYLMRMAKILGINRI